MTDNEIKENKFKSLLDLDIQYFSEEPPEGDGSEGGGGNEETPPTDKTFTQSEVDSQISKAVQTALDNRDAKHKDDMQKAIDNAIAEKERLSKLSDKERKDEELTKRERKLEKRLAEIERKELLSDAVADLNKKELPTEFAEVLLGEDAESTLENINSFKTAFDKAVNDVVKEKLRQDTPPAGGGTSNNKNTIAQLRNKKDQQQNKAPDLWA